MKRLELQLRDGTFVVTEAAATKSSQFARYQDDTVLWNDRLYEPSIGIFSCFDGKNGSVIWQKRMGPTFATTFADGHFYFHADDGRMRLVEPAETEPRVKSEFVLPDHKNSLGTTTPIVTGGRLFVREDDQLFCYDVRAEAAKLPASVPLQVVLTAPDAKLRADLHERTLRSVFVPTPNDLVDKMLELASVKQTDVVFDLGSGDGRIVISAAKNLGCKAVGYELDAELFASSRAKAQQAGVESLVTLENKDLFTADLSNADVLAVYLLPQQLTKLLPQLEKMKPGSRVVSHQFEIPGFPADKTLRVRSVEDGQEHAVHLWTLPLPKPMRRITWQNIHIYHTAFSPDGQWFLGGGDTNVAHIWEVASGKRLVELPVPIAHFTPDGKQLVGHNQSQNVFVFDAVSGREVRRWETPSPVVSLAIAPNGKQVVSGHADKVLRQWEFATGQEIRKLEGHTERATAIFSPDSQRILSASRDKSVRLWNADSGQLLRTFADFQNATPIPSHDLIVQAFFLPDGQQIAGYVWGNEKSLIVWNAETGAVVRKFDLGTSHHKEVAISPDGRWFLTGHSDRTVRVRDLMTGTEVRRWEMQGVYVPRALNFSPDSRLVLAGSHRGLINLWRLGQSP